MDLKTRVLFSGVLIFAFLSLGFTIYKTFVAHDFEIINIPETEA